ncbi:hypothetical protein BST24_24035 [Mycobacteroides franklinii]|nr:hypothetical protein BST24_24035 [Mycobacteroides franklinii]
MAQHQLGQLIDDIKVANGWSDPDLVRNAKEKGYVLSKSNISRYRLPFPSIKGEVILSLAAGLRVAPARVAVAAIESMGILLPQHDDAPTPEQAVRLDHDLSERDRDAVLALLAQLRSTTRQGMPRSTKQTQEVDPGGLATPQTNEFESIVARMSDIAALGKTIEAQYTERGLGSGRAKIPSSYFRRFLHMAVIDALYDRIIPESRGLAVHQFDTEEWMAWLAELAVATAEYDKANMAAQAKLIEVLEQSRIDQLEVARDFVQNGLKSDELMLMAIESLESHWQRRAEELDVEKLTREARGVAHRRQSSTRKQAETKKTLERRIAEVRRRLDEVNSTEPKSAEGSPENDALSRSRLEIAWPPYLPDRRPGFDELSEQTLWAVAGIIAQSLAEQYTEMRRRAREGANRQSLLQQARLSLGDNPSLGQSYAPEVSDGLYVQYLAARLSTPHQGGEPDLHAQLPLSDAEYAAAHARYRREFSEMVIFGGEIRTVTDSGPKSPNLYLRTKRSEADLLNDPPSPESNVTGREHALRPGISRVHGNVPYLTPEEFLPGGVDPTSPGDEQADHG